ncbi:mannan endo-1,4-beta-mannosidase 6-like [Canna indica]|uniref:mannan endo-1,4-beta-mannosidase n=1 Tax=Canna indica TaxID=4628 RepID=A0AAQ3JTU7_9LILI|nr:mannan endo-1,4-beta-mannosidase 6-like [Canna indica]
MAIIHQKTSVFSPLSLRFQTLLLLAVFLITIGKTNADALGHDEYLETVQDMKKSYYASTSRHERVHEDYLDGVEDEEWGMVERRGNQFVLGSQPFYVNGFNTYWLMLLAVDLSTRGKVSDVLRQASSVGLTVCRTWAFNDGGWRALQKSPSVYDEEVFKALDFVVSEAKKYKIRLILPLVNNWEGFGGKAQYVNWAKAAGFNLTSDEDFFTDPTVKSYYKAHVKAVLTRVNTLTNITYKDDPTIFAWELMNEPRCLSDPSGNKLQEWIQEMAFHVKSIDSVHLLGTGSEGFYGPSTPDRLKVNPNTFAGQVGTDFIRNHKTLGVDYASAHIYPDTWISKSASQQYIQFATSWVQSHIDDAEADLRLPVVFGEYGVSSKVDKFNATLRNAFMGAVYSTLLNSTRRGGSGAGSLLWQLFPEGTEYMDDGYGVVLSKNPGTSNMVSLQSRRLQMFNAKCSMKCRWSCKKKSPKDVDLILPHDEL